MTNTTLATHYKRRLPTGIMGLDNILGGGLTPNRLYLVEGSPGAGKTTLALQFLLDGVRSGEAVLYLTLSETRSELLASAATHGWDLRGVEIVEVVSDEGLDPRYEQSILHPAEVELGETVKNVIEHVEAGSPARIVIDSLSELRLLAQNPLRYRRQVLALKRYFATRECTVLMLDDNTSEPNDLQLHSIAHGVISLDQVVHDYGGVRRRLRVAKMRGMRFREGFHDITLNTGGIAVFPRLIAAEHHLEFSSTPISTGSAGLDDMLGGGLVPGTNTLFVGPSGAGKTTTAIRCLKTALERGQRCVYYLFDETLVTLLARAKALGMDLRPHMDNGLLNLRRIDPAEISPGEFASDVRCEVEQRGATFVSIDSLNAYLQAMPGERFLLLQMHELLGYLNQQGVISVVVLGQHGVIGDMHSSIDMSYLSDVLVLFRFFEHGGAVRTAVSTVKSRVARHERTIREFRVSSRGIEVGDALKNFEGVFSGLPAYQGTTDMLGAQPADSQMSE